jgi:hypothetical protein
VREDTGATAIQYRRARPDSAGHGRHFCANGRISVITPCSRFDG